MATFLHRGQRLAYTEYGADAASQRATILIHGLLLSQRMHQPLAQSLAKRGNRTITLDLLGHGESERPTDMWRYSMTEFGKQVIALIDHLELDDAVVLGTSLGANSALEAAVLAPERLRGMVIEMPVLEGALVASALAFAPLLVGLTLGEPVARVVSHAARAVPHRLVPFWGDVFLDTVRQDPAPSAAVLQGLFFGRTAPHRVERRTIRTPALILGHHRDPVHPFSDAGMLHEELANSRLVEANSLLELRLRPRRLTDEIAAFLDECWRPRGAQATKPTARADDETGRVRRARG